jgi:hypothetical protein
MKTWKQCACIGIVATLIIVFAISCNGSNGLSGTWETDSLDKYRDPDNEYRATIEFKGKRISITEYPHITWGGTGEPLRLYPRLSNELSFINREKYPFSEEDVILATPFGAWENSVTKAPYGTGYGDWRVSKQMYDRNERIIFRSVTKGTYSISDNKIEMVFSGGSIEVYSFSRTENTITIGKVRFTRSQRQKPASTVKSGTRDTVNLNGAWVSRTKDYDFTVVITDSAWTIAIPAIGHSESGKYTRNGNTGVFKDNSNKVEYGTATIVNNNTINLSLNSNTEFPGTYTLTKQ